jgi:hypothetical protein
MNNNVDVPTIKFEDDPAPFEFVKPNGYYQVGDKFFNFKVTAFAEATRTKQHPKWWFNNDVLDTFNWRKPVETDIYELYKMRAQQLRDKYDYLIVSYSGGSDTSTLVNAFLDNGIHLDEIMVDWALTEQGKYTPNTVDKSSANFLSEWDFSIKPQLDRIRKDFPGTKITITDSTEAFGVEDNYDTCLITHRHHYVSAKRWRKLAQRTSEIMEKYPNSAMIMGTEKPGLYIFKNVLCLFFYDDACFFKSSCLDPVRRIEYFYWTPDLPDLMAKQAQLIYNHLLVNPQHRSIIVPPSSSDGVESDYYLLNSNLRMQLVKSIIYPKWDLNIFQAGKVASTIDNPNHIWTKRDNDHWSLQSWRSNMRSWQNALDSKYYFLDKSGNIRDYLTITGKLHPIGAF